MEENYRDAFSEVYVILQQMEKENLNKIPKKFLECIIKNRNINYEPILTSDKKLIDNTSVLKRETKIILAIMYRNYFCSPEERKIKEKEYKEELDKIYNYDNLFKKEKKEKIKNDEELLDISKENFIKKFIMKIRRKLQSLIKRR